MLFMRTEQKGKDKQKSVAAKLGKHWVKQAEALLHEKSYTEEVKKFRQQLGFSEDNYKNLALSLVHRYAEFVQELPETRNSYYAQLGGMLSHAIHRTASALSLCRAYFLSEGSTSQLSQAQSLWMYALFTAAILYGVGKIYTDVTVSIYDERGRHVKNWLPLEGNLFSQGPYYDYEFTKLVYQDPFRRRVTLLLARQLLPEEGFRWIASDKNVFAVWLALLDDDLRNAGTLGTVLIRAEAQTLSDHFDKKRQRAVFAKEGDEGKALPKKTSGMFSVPQDSKSTTETKPGEATVAGMEFIKWMYQNFVEENLAVNKSPVRVVPAGLLIGPDLLKLFIRESSDFKNWRAVQTSLETYLNIDENGQEKFADEQGKPYQGVVLNNRDLAVALHSEAKLQSGQTHKVDTILHAVAQQQGLLAPKGVVSQAQYLTTSGQWVNQANPLGVSQEATPINPWGK